MRVPDTSRSGTIRMHASIHARPSGVGFAGTMQIALLLAAGCVPISNAPLPSSVQPYDQIERALYCIAETKVVRDRTFVVGAFADSTGKINSVAPGSTGNFLPQGGSASYITDALIKSGANVVSTYFGVPPQKVPAEYMMNGIFNSLDFDSPFAADVEVNGIGPTAAAGIAQLSLTIQLDAAGTRLNRQISLIQRPVRYAQLGGTVARTFGPTLVTGSIAAQDQERLQLEALNGPIGLGVADVLMKEFPAARKRCGRFVKDLLPATKPGPSAIRDGR